MANRYGYPNYPRYGKRRRGSGFRPENRRRRYGSDYDIDRYGSSRFGGYDYDRQENYFGGGGNLGYGSGFTGTEYDRGFSSYNRDYEDDYVRYNRPSRAYTGGYGTVNDSERIRYYTDRYGSEYDRDESGGYYGSGDTGIGSRYDEDYYEPVNYFEDYDSGERGWWNKASDEVASWFGDEEAARRRRMDERRQGFRGRGPRNYTRSDDRIQEDINDSLTDDYFLDASEIDVEVNNCEVVLKGTVESKAAKRRAEDLAEVVSGVTNVENRIRINRNYSGQESAYSDASTGITS